MTSPINVYKKALRMHERPQEDADTSLVATGTNPAVTWFWKFYSTSNTWNLLTHTHKTIATIRMRQDRYNRWCYQPTIMGKANTACSFWQKDPNGLWDAKTHVEKTLREFGVLRTFDRTVVINPANGRGAGLLTQRRVFQLHTKKSRGSNKQNAADGVNLAYVNHLPTG